MRACVHVTISLNCPYGFDSDNLVEDLLVIGSHSFHISLTPLPFSVPNPTHISLDAVRKCLISQAVR